MWIEQLGLGLRAVESDGKAYRIAQLNLQYNSGRGESRVGLILDRDGYTFSCALSLGGRRTIYDLGIRVNSSRKRRIVRRKRPFFLLRYAKNIQVMEFTGRMEERRIYTHLITVDCLRCMMHWWFKDVDGRRRYLATGLRCLVSASWTGSMGLSSCT